MKKIFNLLIMVSFLSQVFLFADTTDVAVIKEKDDNIDTVEIAIMIATQYPDYPATPGDIYEISFLTAGNTEKTVVTGFVDRNYNIDLSFIGNINVRGLIYSEVQKDLKDKISYAYPGSIVEVMIKAAGSFKVTLLGEVLEASVIDAMSLTSLSEVIEDLVTEYASYRNIEIRSEDGSYGVYDLFQFKRFANKKHNPYLKPNDVITIRPYVKSIEVTGAVKRPGVYQLLEKETLYDLINIHADGFTKLADKSNIEVLSVMKESLVYSDGAKYINAESINLSLVKLNDFDTVYVKSQIKFAPRVTIQGAIASQSNIPTSDDTITTYNGTSVSNKITVPLVSDNKVSTILKRMEGVFNLQSDLEHAVILRNGNRIYVNLKDVLESRNSSFDIVMEDDDILIIPFRQLHVYVAGAVNESGAIPFIEDRTAKYYIGLANGFNSEKNLFRTYTVTNVYGNRLPKDSIIGPEDVIWVNTDHPLYYIGQYQNWITAFLGIAGTYFIFQDMKTYIDDM